MNPFVVQVTGDSMLPTLRPGDRVIIDVERPLRLGDIVVVERDGTQVIHRIVTVAPLREMGDNTSAARRISRSDVAGVARARIREGETEPLDGRSVSGTWVPLGRSWARMTAGRVQRIIRRPPDA